MNHLQKFVSKGVRKLLLNLADLTQVDSSGVSIIVETYVSLKHRGGATLKLVRPEGRVLEVFNLLHLLEKSSRALRTRPKHSPASGLKGYFCKKPVTSPEHCDVANRSER